LRGEPRGASALKQRTSNFVFEVRDLLADGGLGDAEMARGFAEGSVFGDGAEVAEVAEFHGG
jgi:hypothetical protein